MRDSVGRKMQAVVDGLSGEVTKEVARAIAAESLDDVAALDDARALALQDVLGMDSNGDMWLEVYCPYCGFRYKTAGDPPDGLCRHAIGILHYQDFFRLDDRKVTIATLRLTEDAHELERFRAAVAKMIEHEAHPDDTILARRQSWVGNGLAMSVLLAPTESIRSLAEFLWSDEAMKVGEEQAFEMN